MHRPMAWNVCGESYTPEGTTYVNFFVLGYDLCIIMYHVKCKYGSGKKHKKCCMNAAVALTPG